MQLWRSCAGSLDFRDRRVKSRLELNWLRLGRMWLRGLRRLRRRPRKRRLGSPPGPSGFLHGRRLRSLHSRKTRACGRDRRSVAAAPRRSAGQGVRTGQPREILVRVSRVIPGAGEGFRGDDRAVLSSGLQRGHEIGGTLFEKGGGRAALRRGRRRLRGLKRRVCGALRDFRQEWSLGRGARLRPRRPDGVPRSDGLRWGAAEHSVAPHFGRGLHRDLRRAKSSRCSAEGSGRRPERFARPRGPAVAPGHRSAPARA